MNIVTYSYICLLFSLIQAVQWDYTLGCGYQHVRHHYTSAVDKHLDASDSTLQIFGPLWESKGIPIHGVKCNKDGSCSRSRKLLATTENPYPIRIQTEFQLGNLDNGTQAVARTLVSGAVRTLQKFLQVKAPVHGNLLVTPTCGRVYYTEVNGVRTREWCYQIDPDFSSGTQEVCSQVKMNPDHFGPATTCDESGNNCNTRSGGTGAPVDMYVYVTAKSESGSNCGSDYLAYAQPCYFDLVTNRPLVAAINICPATLAEGSSDSYEFDKQMDVIVHELVHSLGFTNDLFKMFWDGSKVLPESSVVQSYQSPFNANKMVTWVVTPNVAREAQKHFACSSLPGMPMEDEGGKGVELSHWEFRVAQGELMSPITPLDGTYQQFSRLTLALLEDTGWYVVDYTQAGYLDWGNNGGCAFVQGTCQEYMAKNTDQPWFCSDADVAADCTSTLEATGNCTASSSAKSLSNGCGIVQAYSGIKNCEVAGSVDNAISEYMFWAYGPAARCVQVNYPLVTANTIFPAQGPNVPDAESYCLNFTCQSEALFVTIYDKSIPCPEGQFIQLKDHFNQFTKGSIGPCPAAARICTTLDCGTKCNIPYGGNCRDNKCYCNIGYTGSDCSTRYSGLPPLPPAPQSSLPPSTSANLPQTTPTQAALGNAARKAQDFFTNPSNRTYIYIAAGVAGALLVLTISLWCCRRKSVNRQTKYQAPANPNTMHMTANAALGRWSPAQYNYQTPPRSSGAPTTPQPPTGYSSSPAGYPPAPTQPPAGYPPAPSQPPAGYPAVTTTPVRARSAAPVGGNVAPYQGQSRSAQPLRPSGPGAYYNTS